MDEAIATLAPAEACTEFDFPDLATWRAIAGRLEAEGGGRIDAAFVGDPSDPVSLEVDAALRAA